MPVGAELIARLFHSHARALVLYARQLCDDSDDVVQQAFLKLAGQKVGPDEPVAWLYRVVRNEALLANRSAQRRERREVEVARIKGDWFAASASDAIDARSAATAMASLPLDQREILTAHIWGRLSFRDIGRLMGSSNSTVHRRYLEAIESLRERIGSSCP